MEDVTIPTSLILTKLGFISFPGLITFLNLEVFMAEAAEVIKLIRREGPKGISIVKCKLLALKELILMKINKGVNSALEELKREKKEETVKREI